MGRVDIVVACAGMPGGGKSFLEASVETFDRVCLPTTKRNH